MKNVSEVRGDMDRSVYTEMCSQVQFIFQVLQLPVCVVLCMGSVAQVHV